MADELGEDCPEVPLVTDDHVIQTFPAQGADQPFGNRVRAGRPDRGEGRLDAQAAGVGYGYSARSMGKDW